MGGEGDKKYEVGIGYYGCNDVEHQRGALQSVLDSCGNDVNLWHVAPKVVEHHNHDATVEVSDFGRKYAVNTGPCSWAVLGWLHEEPKDKRFLLVEGVRLTPNGSPTT